MADPAAPWRIAAYDQHLAQSTETITSYTAAYRDLLAQGNEEITVMSNLALAAADHSPEELPVLLAVAVKMIAEARGPAVPGKTA